jgi:23S rRNA (uracil1939-C5)-methyltransferase
MSILAGKIVGMEFQRDIEVELTTLAHGGEALGRLPDGRAVFVPFALPGERVRARVIEEKSRYLRAELVEVISPSAQRVPPRCAHYGVCGGCHYQHLLYEAQLAARSVVLSDQLERIGGIAIPPVQPAVASQPWNYRNHVQFHLTPGGKLGYYTHDARRVFPVEECHLPQELINRVWPQLEFDGLPEVERVGLRQGDEGDLQLILESSDPRPPEINIEELDISVVHLSPAGSLVLAGSAATTITLLGRSFQVSAGSFFQVNPSMAEKMVAYVLGEANLPAEAVLLDVYCGVGLFSAFLAPLARRLIAIEASEQACNDFAANLDEFDHVELYQAPAEDVLPVLDAKPDLIIVDPPRSGLGRGCLQALLTLFAPVIVYVSCDPATLARDGRRLIQGGYQLQKITPFDLFPQTYHVESVSIWERQGHSQP